MARRTRMTPRDRIRAAGPVTVISPDEKNEKGWSRREAIAMLDQGYSVAQVYRITGYRLPERRNAPAVG